MRCGLRGGDGGIHVGGVVGGHLAKHRHVGRLDHLDGVGRRDQPAADQGNLGIAVAPEFGLRGGGDIVRVFHLSLPGLRPGYP